MIGAYVTCVATLITRAFLAASDCMWLQTVHTFIWGVLLVIGFKFLNIYGGLGLAVSYFIAYSILTFIQIGSQTLIMNRLKTR